MIDLSYLNDITDEDPVAKSQLIELFINQSQEITENFLNAQKKGDVDEIGRIAHLAKSTSKVMGIFDVSEKMQELQELVDRHENADRYNELVEFYYSAMPGNISLLRHELDSIKSANTL